MRRFRRRSWWRGRSGGSSEPPGINDCPSVCQARQWGQRFSFYGTDRQCLTRAKCTVQNA
ncbi:hypothetical protein AL532_14775 [Pseudomonas monteilii]|uniref:Uncharacterized protein n=1 Tax=Pseudomonas monteilii TaxID=76759 RepID=A0A7X3F6F9_9PSED|nr:hypothetical protein AL532_14775 [Pseudomonas monteilii]MVF52029.1 hypothetical protein [Pseudomonas monteilii]